jgi:hypothetical protein
MYRFLMYWLFGNCAYVQSCGTQYIVKEDVWYMKKKIALTILLSALIITAMSSIVLAQTVNVTIGYPNNSNGDLGITSGSNWIGQFLIQINSGSTTSSGEAYCLNYDNTIYEGSTYPANITLANDTAQWRAISYILSWYTPTDNNGAATSQVAIWRLIDNYNPSIFNLPSSIETAAANLAATATSKDVARQGDHLAWITPGTGNTSAAPGQTTTFQFQLTNSSGTPRPNVRIDFNATLRSPIGTIQTLNSTYITSAQSFTDSNGKAQVTITVPSDTAFGSTLKVQASTQSIWPQEYLDLTSYTSRAQNLIGPTPERVHKHSNHGFHNGASRIWNRRN